MKIRDEKLEKVIVWAQENPDIKAVLLTSSLVNPLAPVDDFSDLDIELVFENVEKYISNSDWLKLFGNPVAMIEEDEKCFDNLHAMKMVLYEDGVKIDFKLYNKQKFVEATNFTELPEDWDIGYKIMVDKENLTQNLQKPSYNVSIIKKPSEQQFQQLLNDFWWDTTYVAKCLARDEIFYAKFMSENNLRTAYFVPLTEWKIASGHGWNITTNKHGRLFKKYLNDSMWQKIETTFSGASIDENWKALFAMCDLVHEFGTDLAQQLAFNYPFKLENDIRNYLEKIHEK